MNVPKEIAEKAKQYQEAMNVANKAFEEVTEWLKNNTEADGVFINSLFVVDKPTGKKQGDGEYCEQHSIGFDGDCFYGNYYHPIEGSTQYLGYAYDC